MILLLLDLISSQFMNSCLYHLLGPTKNQVFCDNSEKFQGQNASIITVLKIQKASLEAET